MNRQHTVLRRLITSVTNGGAELTRQPILELLSDRQVLVENHLGVMEYSHEKIRIKVSTGCIHINGEQLHLCQMSENQLVIRGNIHTIQLFRRAKA